MMRKMMRFCCEGVDIMTEPETREKITISKKTAEPCHRAKDATVIPAKRKCVKNMVCNCIVHCICGKCLNTNPFSPQTPTAPNFNKRSSVCSPPPAKYGKETKGILYKWQTK